MDEKKEYPPMQLGWSFRFGKYKGRTLLDIIGENREYITWLLEKEVIKLDREAHERYKMGDPPRTSE